MATRKRGSLRWNCTPRCAVGAETGPPATTAAVPVTVGSLGSTRSSPAGNGYEQVESFETETSAWTPPAEPPTWVPFEPTFPPPAPPPPMAVIVMVSTPAGTHRDCICVPL